MKNTSDKYPCSPIPTFGTYNRRIRVFVIDDNESTRQYYIRLLQGMNFEVRSFMSCTEVENHLLEEELKSDEKPDIIISDIHMPVGIDGITFARIFRNEYPVLLFSFDETALNNVREEGFSTVDKLEDDSTIFSKINKALHDHNIVKTTVQNERSLYVIHERVEKLDKKLDCHVERMESNFCELKDIMVQSKTEHPTTNQKLWNFVKSPNFANFTQFLGTLLGALKWMMILIFLMASIFLGTNPKFQKSLEKVLPVLTSVAKTK